MSLLHSGLLRHHKLWLAVLLDRPRVPNYKEPSFLLTAGLIKLRDLPHDHWNADMLFVLTRSHELAREMARIIDEEEWGGELQVYDKQEDIDRALGVGRQPYGLLSVWWD